MPLPSDKAFLDAMERLVRKEITFKFDCSPDTLFCIIAHIQLALRHPNSGGSSADLARTWCEAAIAYFRAFDSTIADVLTAGFDPSQDQPTGGR